MTGLVSDDMPIVAGEPAKKPTAGNDYLKIAEPDKTKTLVKADEIDISPSAFTFTPEDRADGHKTRLIF